MLLLVIFLYRCKRSFILERNRALVESVITRKPFCPNQHFEHAHWHLAHACARSLARALARLFTCTCTPGHVHLHVHLHACSRALAHRHSVPPNLHNKKKSAFTRGRYAQQMDRIKLATCRRAEQEDTDYTLQNSSNNTDESSSI